MRLGDWVMSGLLGGARHGQKNTSPCGSTRRGLQCARNVPFDPLLQQGALSRAHDRLGSVLAQMHQS